MKKELILFPFLFIFLVFLFFYPFILEGKVPIPADTIVGMYHPWRDFYAKDYPNGLPFKNFLITDPVRQQYVWRNIAIESLKEDHLPFWNPYNFSGGPLLANFQSASFYPLNILFFIFPFNFAWSILVLLQPLLGGIFLYFYLKNLKLDNYACFLGGVVFSFSGFSIAWLEWNTILHVGLWLPLILLVIDKIVESFNVRENLKLQTEAKKILVWFAIFLLSLVSSFLAGHLQIFFYIFIFSFIYLFLRWRQSKKKVKIAVGFVICYLLFVILTSIQWFPTFQFINLSARQSDLSYWQQSSWFLPWQHLIQFFAPDFFGNPATLNYWGEWNYGEFIGYIGIIPLILALFAFFWRKDRKTRFFGIITFFLLVFTLPTFLAKLPYYWQVPLISTSQPTRLLFLIDFSLAILSALGLDYFLKNLNDLKHLRKLIKTSLILGIAFLSLWFFVFFGQDWFKTTTAETISIAKRNLILPTVLFLTFIVFCILSQSLIYKMKIKNLFIFGILSIIIFDLFRFSWKFTPFVNKELLFPETKAIEFLKSQPKPFRFMAIDRKIFPPNFATFYKLEDVAGYDPLYLKNYGELVASWQQNKPETNLSSFNRILTPTNYLSRITDLLNVKYILSLKEENSSKLRLVFQEGQTRVYENKNVYPRAFLVYDFKIAHDPKEAIRFLFDEKIDLRKTAILEKGFSEILEGEDENGKVQIISYEPQKIVLKTFTQKPAILVLADIFYPGWQAFLDGKQESEEIFKVDFILRGMFVPKGEHLIKFIPSL